MSLTVFGGRERRAGMDDGLASNFETGLALHFGAKVTTTPNVV